MTIYKGTELLSSSAPIATTSQAGVVKPDGTTVTVTADGTISAQAGASALTDLTDVSISTPANDQVLKYNSTSQKWENGTSSGGVTDVKINGTSIVTEGVASIPKITGTQSMTAGLVWWASSVYAGSGFTVDSYGFRIASPTNQSITGRKAGLYGGFGAITTSTYDFAVKAAMCDGVGAAWTSTEQAAARTRMDVDQATQTQTITDASTITLANNTVYTASSALTSLTITYPASPATTFICKMSFTTGASMTFAVPSGTIMKGDDCSSSVFSPQANSSYVIMFSTDGTNNYGLTMKLS